MPIPPYVARLRSFVGHELLWMPAVTAVVTDAQDRVLLGLRSDLHQWALISGILDPGEEPAHGLRREILEETGVEADPGALVHVESSDTVNYPNGDVSVYLSLNSGADTWLVSRGWQTTSPWRWAGSTSMPCPNRCCRPVPCGSKPSISTVGPAARPRSSTGDFEPK